MKRAPSIFIIFLTVFIDLVGFGIVVPMLPLYTRDFGAHGYVIGLIFAVYSAMQFVFSPIWGKSAPGARNITTKSFRYARSWPIGIRW